MGDELLFQQLAGKNIETFERFGVRRGAKRIVSHCPHCVNSFRQDYSQLGADLDVIHHTEFLDELIRGESIESFGEQFSQVGTGIDQRYLPRSVLPGASAKCHRCSASVALEGDWRQGNRRNAASRTSDVLLRRRWRTDVVRRYCRQTSRAEPRRRSARYWRAHVGGFVSVLFNDDDGRHSRSQREHGRARHCRNPRRCSAIGTCETST